MSGHAKLLSWQQLLESWVGAHIHDGAHDISHNRRVWSKCIELSTSSPQPLDLEVLLVASYFHDLVNYPKNSDQRATSADASAAEALRILRNQSVISVDEDKLTDAITCHSFSAKKPPLSIEGKILSDADKLDALGSIGVARLFYTSGRIGAQLFDPDDPLSSNRSPNDLRYTVDHYFTKLSKLPGLMFTDYGRELANIRLRKLADFLDELLEDAGFKPDARAKLRSFPLANHRDLAA